LTPNFRSESVLVWLKRKGSGIRYRASLMHAVIATFGHRLLNRPAARTLSARAETDPREASPRPDSQEGVVFSCVVDSPPAMAYAAWIWATTLTTYGGQHPSSLAVHFVEDCAPELRRALEALGIPTARVDRFDVSNPPSNKLTQLTSPLLADAEYCVLCDCDLAFCGDISPWVIGNRIRAKLVDCAGFDLDRWRGILSAAGLQCPGADGSLSSVAVSATLDGKLTLPTYCNGGLLIVPRQAFETLSETWPRWNRWLCERSDLLGTASYHADQVSFALACLDADLQIDFLPNELNLPTHLPGYLRRLKGVDPLVLHFHRRVDSQGMLQPTGVKSVDRRITQVNTLIGQELHRRFDNAIFWNNRYSSHPDLGSGVGSRGKVARAKRRIIATVLAEYDPSSILDVGCGDLEIWNGLEPSDYTGVDLSHTAIDIARRKRPDWRFITGDILTLPLQPRELVLALDVLIHQPSRHDYEQLLTGLIALAGRYLIVSGYERQSTMRSAITFCFEPLGQTLVRLTPGGSVTMIGQYRDVDMLLWRRDA
jgi:hypothetical protein